MRKLLVIIFLLCSFSNVHAEERVFLVCEETKSNSWWWETAFIILEESDGDKKKAKLGFEPHNVTYFPGSDDIDFVKVKDDWSGKIGMREIKFNASENEYSWSRDETVYGKTGNKVITGNVIRDETVYVPNYEKLKINRTDLSVDYRYYNPSQYRNNMAERFFFAQCAIEEKKVFEEKMFVAIDKGWKKGVKKAKKRLKKQKKLNPQVEQKVNPKI